MHLSKPRSFQSSEAQLTRAVCLSSADAPPSIWRTVTEVSWVRELPEAQAREAVAAARVHRYSAGSVVTMAGNDACLITVLAGSVFVEAGRSASDIGPYDWQAAPANFLTGASLVEGPSIMTITASSDVIIARWPRTFTFRCGDQNPQLTCSLAGILGALAARAMQSTADMLLPTAERRCAAIILRLSENTATLPVSQQALGQMANVSRSGAGSILLSFARAGIVELEYRKVIVRDRAALSAIREGATRHPYANLQLSKSDGSEPCAVGARRPRPTNTDTLHSLVLPQAIVG